MPFELDTNGFVSDCVEFSVKVLTWNTMQNATLILLAVNND